MAQPWAADGPIDQLIGQEDSRLNGSEMEPLQQSQVIQISQETYAQMSEYDVSYTIVALVDALTCPAQRVTYAADRAEADYRVAQLL